MRTLTKLSLRTLLLGTCLAVGAEAGPTESSPPADGADEACFVERTVQNIRTSITDALDSAHNAAQSRYVIDMYVPAPPAPPATDPSNAHREMFAPLPTDREMPEHAVILVHGLDEVGSIWSTLAPAMHEDGFTVLRLRYPNDGRIAPSSAHFASLLVELRTMGVSCVDLVAHSMGGLVSYEMLTSDGLYGGRAKGHADLPDVGRLITIGTPWHGSPFAPLRGVAEFREHMAELFDGDGRLTDRALGFLCDGSGEAGEDLCAGSDFLTALNARPLPTGVRITTVVGRLETDEAQSWREGMIKSKVSTWLLGKENTSALVGYTNGVSGTIGDGVVPFDSAHLNGIEDVVYHQADHRSLIKELDAPGFVRSAIGAPKGDPPAIATVLERLREACGCHAHE